MNYSIISHLEKLYFKFKTSFGRNVSPTELEIELEYLRNAKEEGEENVCVNLITVFWFL